ncbi:MAG: YihY/virulence factor BrkB family protein [Anaerolineae bacterium]
MKTLKNFFDILRATFKEWNEDGAPRLAAALAYYTAFSIAPLIVIVLAIVGFVVSSESVQQDILSEVSRSISPEAAELVSGLIDNVNQPRQGLISTVLGVVTLLFGAMAVFNNLQTSLDIMWDVDQLERKPGIKGFLLDKLLSFGMLLVVGFLLLTSLVVSTALSAVDVMIFGSLPGAELLARALSFGLSFGMITLLFAMIYKFLPHVQIEWRDVWTGAAVTALLFTIGQVLLGLYLGNSSTASAYGAAGAFVLVLLWIYYSAQIVLFGAEFTQVYARRRGKTILPDVYNPEAYASIRPQGLDEDLPGPAVAPVMAEPPGKEKDGHKTSRRGGLLVGLGLFIVGFITSWVQSRGDEQAT